jgi:hypothetical protein
MMNQDLYRQTMKFGAIGGVLFCVLLGIGWAGIAGWFPPPSPTLTQDQVAEMYRTDFMKIRVGCLFMMIGTLFFIPFTGAVTTILSRIEGRFGVLSVCGLCGGLVTAIFIFYPTQWWYTAAFRPDRAAELLYVLNDWAWLQFVGAAMPAIPMWLALSIAALAEKGEDRFFPRWYGYFTAWITISFLPSQLLFFVKTGPFAWDGALALYFPAVMFFIWFFPTVYFIWRAANRPA